MTNLQFRVLYREFLFRMFDLELLSADALGDASKLLGRFAALLIVISIFLAAHALELEGSCTAPAMKLLQAWQFEHFLIATTMLVVGLFAVLSWESTFPDRRDVLVLAPLPIRARTLFVAKASAVATALGLAVFLLHGAAGLVWPLVLAPQAPAGSPGGSGILGLVRCFAAYWMIMLGAGGFVFCCVLGLQGFAAQLLPRRLFLRLSSFLQLSVFCIVVSVYLLQPLLPSATALLAANDGESLAVSPSYWFLGLFQQLNGSPALAPLARRAWMGLAAAVSGAAIAYTLCYCRTLRKIVEEPDIVPGARGGVWLPPFGGPLPTAIVQFSIRTLLRSRLHRLILAFYLGMGFAFLVLLLKTARDQPAGAPVTEPWDDVDVPLLAASVVMMALSVIGTRVIFSIPLDLRANWIFRVTAVRRVAECLPAGRLSLLLISAAPVWAASAVLYLRFSPWRAAAGHLAILTLFALILAELCLLRFDKIPFTCSYLPGKSQLHIAVLSASYLLWIIGLNARYERQLSESPASLAALLLALAMVWACARWRNAARARSEQAEVQFEESEPAAVQGLGLNRDGSWPMGETAAGHAEACPTARSREM